MNMSNAQYSSLRGASAFFLSALFVVISTAFFIFTDSVNAQGVAPVVPAPASGVPKALPADHLIDVLNKVKPGFNASDASTFSGTVKIGGATEAAVAALEIAGSITIQKGNSLKLLTTIGNERGILFAQEASPHLIIRTSGSENIALQDGTDTNLFIQGSNGNVGIGTASPKHDLDIASANFGLQRSDVSPNAGYLRFGDNTGWKFHIGRAQESVGAAYNSDTTGVLFTVQDNGSVGIGTISPSEKLNIYDGSLTINGTGSQGWQGRVKSWGALAFYPDTDKNGDDDIRFYNNEPKEMMNIDTNGYIHLLSGSNPIRFSPGWTGFPDGTTNQAEISNDTGTYKTLMIVGNRAGDGSTRKVSVWDRLEVNGSLGVTGDISSPNFELQGWDAVLHSRDNAGRYFDLIGSYQGWWGGEAVIIAGYNAVTSPGARAAKYVSVGNPDTSSLWVDIPNRSVSVPGTLSSWRTQSTKDSYPRWQSRYGCGYASSASWAKILSMSNGTTPANIYWDGINFKGKMIVHNGNFGQNVPSEFPFDGSIYFSYRDTTPGRERGVVVDRPELRLSAGTPDIIRLVKLGTNNYELQVRQHEDWQCLEYEIQVVNALFNDGGTYSYHDRAARGGDTTVAATYTYPTYTGSVVANNVGTYNGSDWLRLATANDSNYSEIAWGDDVTTDRLRFFFDHWDGSNNDKEVMTLLGSGNVGIGTTSPSAQLHVADSARVGDLQVFSAGAVQANQVQAQEREIANFTVNKYHWSTTTGFFVEAYTNYYDSGYVKYYVEAGYGSKDIRKVDSRGDLASRFGLRLDGGEVVGTRGEQDEIRYRLYAQADYYSQWKVYVSTAGMDVRYGDVASDGQLGVKKDSTYSNILSLANNDKASTFEGNVGIGTTSPNDKLQVGNGLAFHDGGHKLLGFGFTPGNGKTTMDGYPAEIRFIPDGQPGGPSLRVGMDDTRRTAGSDTSSWWKWGLTLVPGGNVGIGPWHPSYPLTITKNGGDWTSYGKTKKIQLMVNGTNQTGGGVAVSDDGGFFDWNDGYVTYEPLCCGWAGFRVNSKFVVDGNVGIGMLSPNAKMYIAGGAYSGNAGNSNQSAYALGAQSIAADASIYSYGPICAGNGSGNCGSGSGVTISPGTTVGTPNVAISGSGKSYFNAGEVGIGVTDPQYKLEVKGRINVLATSENQNGKIAYADTFGMDIAEVYETSEDVVAADVLVVGDDGRLQKARQQYDRRVAGVVSRAPALLLEGSELKVGPERSAFTSGKKPPVALAGKVKVKVTMKNGAIHAGDAITTSDIPGVGMRATESGPAFGIALENYEGWGIGEITVILRLGDSQGKETEKLKARIERLEALVNQLLNKKQ